METIDDIVRDMRIGDIRATANTSSAVERKAFEYINDFLAGYADRIEEALTNCNQLKMREALKYLRDASREFCHLILNSKYNEVYDKYKHPEVAKISDAIAYAGAALAAPPRNCDLYATPKEAGEAFISESCENPCGNCTVSDECHNPLIHECGVKWLFAEAKEVTERK